MTAKIFLTPFGKNGNRAAVPDVLQPSGEVSYDQGFGPDYERQLGVDPQAKNIDRDNYNSLMFDVTTALQEIQSGVAGLPFNAELAAAIGGYAKGALVAFADGSGSWRSTAAANAVNPTVVGSNWRPVDAVGALEQAMTNVNVTLTNEQAAKPVIKITGVLTANVALTLPAWVYSWSIINATTGAFTITVKLASSSGVPLPGVGNFSVVSDALDVNFATTASPTPPQFDNDLSPVNSAFVQRALGNSAGLTVLSGSIALTAVHCGRLLQCFGGSASAVTLPPSSSLAVGAVINLWSNATAPFVVYPQGTDTITDGVTAPATVTVNTGDSVTFEYKGGGSWIMQGALQLGRASSIFGSSLATYGYQKLPSGLIIQWGVLADASWVANTFRTINYVLAFPNGVFQSAATISNSAGTMGRVNTNQLSNSQIQLAVDYSGAATVRWIAIGY